MTAKMDKKVTDWELIEKHYRAGILSNVQIATECDVTEGAIRKRAKRDLWTKNLKAKIQTRAEELVRKELVRTPSTSLTPSTEKEVVEAVAQATATVLIVQKGSIKRSHILFEKLMDELEQTTDNKELFEQLGELLDKSGENADGKMVMDKLNETYRKVISMTGRVDSAKKLTEILEKVVKLEREAFGIESDDKGLSSVDALLKKINAEAT